MLAGMLVIAALSATPVSATASANVDAKKAYEEARASYYKLKADGGAQKLRHNWLRTIAAFTGVAEAYPKSEQAASALYTAAELWNGLSLISRSGSDLDQALANYERVAGEHPASSLADDALYATAVIYHERRHDDAKAARAAKTITEAYATSDMVGKAKAMTTALTAQGVRPAATDETDAKLFGRRDDVPGARQVVDVARWSSPSYSRFSVTLTDAAQARSGWVAPTMPGATKALIVDIAPATLGGVKLPEVDDSLVVGARVEARGADKVRLTVELARNARQRIMVLENPYRVVVDLFGDEETPVKDTPVAKAAHKPRVVIDPGHGGKDVGAIGPGKHYEKDLALAIARATADVLNASGIDARLTRDDDTFVPLEARTAIANKADADLFVSIHLNAAKNTKARGIETYYLDTTSDRYALRLAARENRTSEDRVSDAELILADLATKAAVMSAKKLASKVQKGVYEVARQTDKGTRDHGVKSSLFYVLLGARMPAVLVETGFISNAAEEKLLASAAYQQKLARAIASAVRDSLNVPVAVAKKP